MNNIKHLDLPYTILRPVSLYENFLIPQVKKGILKGKLVQPTKGDVVLQYVASEDVGKAALKAFQNLERYMHKTITLSSEALSSAQAAEIFSSELAFPVKYSKLPWLISRVFLGKDVHKMFSWLNKGNLLAGPGVATGKEEFPEMQDLKDWIHKSFKKDKMPGA